MRNSNFLHKIEIKPTAISRALVALRADVMNLSHAPGSKLKLDQLMQGYGLSSSPLREALNRLSEEGLVLADERRGFFVPELSAHDLQEITRLRLMVDLQALQESITQGDDDWEAEVVASFHRLEKIESKLPKGPVILNAEWTYLHRQFHAQLLAACPSARLLRWSRNLFDQSERYRHLSSRQRPTLKRKDQEHRQLMQAALSRDQARACELLSKHIRATEKNSLKILTKLPLSSLFN